MSDQPGNKQRKPIGGELIIPLMALGFTGYYFKHNHGFALDGTGQRGPGGFGPVCSDPGLLREIGTRTDRGARHAWPGQSSGAGKPAAAAQQQHRQRQEGEGGQREAAPLDQEDVAHRQDRKGGPPRQQVCRRPLLSVGLAALMALVGYGLFIAAFDTRFPKGPFEWLIEAVI